MKRTLTFWLWLALIGAAFTPGCGFHLRGQVQLSYNALYVDGNKASGLVQALARSIRAGNADRLVDSPDRAEAVIQILSEQSSKLILSLSGAGRVREYQLQYRVKYRLHGPKGKDILAPTELLLTRDMSYGDAEVLAKAEEEILLYRDMQSDAAQQILRRVASAR